MREKSFAACHSHSYLYIYKMHHSSQSTSFMTLLAALLIVCCSLGGTRGDEASRLLHTTTTSSNSSNTRHLQFMGLSSESNMTDAEFWNVLSELGGSPVRAPTAAPIVSTASVNGTTPSSSGNTTNSSDSNNSSHPESSHPLDSNNATTTAMNKDDGSDMDVYNMTSGESPLNTTNASASGNSTNKDDGDDLDGYDPYRVTKVPTASPVSYDPYRVTKSPTASPNSTGVNPWDIVAIPKDKIIQYDPDCPALCMNGGNCVATTHTMEHDNALVVSNAYYCNCTDDYQGVDCRIPYKTCDLGVIDRTVKCFNGGTCIPFLEDPTNVEQAFCDCSTAEREDHRYGGKFCEEPIMEYELCPSYNVPRDSEPIILDQQPQQYCLNGGTCVTPSYGGTVIEPCECKHGFHGLHCELRKAQDGCTLDCQNGAMCRLGNQGPWGSKDNMYCVCPPEFAGITCESSAVLCGSDGLDSELLCLHDSKCIQMQDGTFGCDCTSAHTATSLFAGLKCEHQHTDVCTLDGEIDFLSGRPALAFCVNGGKCSDYIFSVYDE
jgi:hypothetical protein